MELRLNFRKDDWLETGMRALENEMALVGVPEERLSDLVTCAEDRGLEVEVAPGEGEGWRVEPEGEASV